MDGVTVREPWDKESCEIIQPVKRLYGPAAFYVLTMTDRRQAFVRGGVGPQRSFQMSRSYSSIVRSEEKKPAWLMFRNIFCAQAVRSAWSLIARCLVFT